MKGGIVMKTTRNYPFDTLAEKLRATYVEAAIDFIVVTVFKEFDGTEDEFKETVEHLTEVFWGANEIVIENFDDCVFKFDRNESINNFNSWRNKVNDFIHELITRESTFDRLDETGKGFYTKNDTHIYVR